MPESVAVGADGQGLLTDYYGVTRADASADGIGSYPLTTRRAPL